MSKLSKEELQSFMESIEYREADIIYKKVYYHIEAIGHDYYVSKYLTEDGPIIDDKIVKGHKGDKGETFKKFLNEKLFDGKSILEIIDDIEIISSR